MTMLWVVVKLADMTVSRMGYKFCLRHQYGYWFLFWIFHDPNVVCIIFKVKDSVYRNYYWIVEVLNNFATEFTPIQISPCIMLVHGFSFTLDGTTRHFSSCSKNFRCAVHHHFFSSCRNYRVLPSQALQVTRSAI